MARSSMRVLASDEVARATAELIFALQKAFPDPHIALCEAIEGESMHLEVSLLTTSPTDLAAAQDRALDLKHAIEDRYDLYIVVRVVPISPASTAPEALKET
jgi:hypothetical protein